VVTLGGLIQRRQREALARALVEHRLEPPDALVPPVSEQLGVEREHTDAAAGQTGAHAGDEIARVNSGLRPRGDRVVRLAVIAPRVMAVGRVTVGVAVGHVRRVPGVTPDERDRLAIDRPQQRAVVADQRLKVASIAEPEHARELDARRSDAGLGEQRIEPPGMAALGQPEAAVPAAESAPVSGEGRLDLKSDAVVGHEQREHRVGRRRGPAPVFAERLEQAAGPELGERPRRGPVVGRRALDRTRQLRLTPPAQLGLVTRVGLHAELGQELEAALDRVGTLELVTQHRGQRKRQRRAPEHAQQRHVAGRDRLPQPLLAERPRAESLDVGHVRVQDDREFARRPAAGADGGGHAL